MNPSSAGLSLLEPTVEALSSSQNLGPSEAPEEQLLPERGEHHQREDRQDELPRDRADVLDVVQPALHDRVDRLADEDDHRGGDHHGEADGDARSRPPRQRSP